MSVVTTLLTLVQTKQLVTVQDLVTVSAVTPPRCLVTGHRTVVTTLNTGHKQWIQVVTTQNTGHSWVTLVTV